MGLYNGKNPSLNFEVVMTYIRPTGNPCSKEQRYLKVSGPFVETPRIFLCMQNINYAEILAFKTTII